MEGNGWKKGPLPPDTYYWGGVVPVGEESTGFYFADFCGDHAKILSGNQEANIITADKVAWYNNSLQLPPSGKGRVE